MFLSNEGHDCLKRFVRYKWTFPVLTYDFSFTPEQERNVLLDLYTSTNGQQWYESGGWNSSNSHCSWYGITCYNNSYVRTIVLAYNNLDGVLPSNLWKIRNLLSLCTPGNPKLRGRIGDFLFGNMSSLLSIAFNAASISGEIPKDIVQLNKLNIFLGCVMNGEGFSGNLPEDVGNMTELRLLCLGGNKFTGRIPSSISRLRRLLYLDLRNTPGLMWGDLNDLFTIPTLAELYVSGVPLTGQLPNTLPPNLTHLVLPGNNITGHFFQNIPKTHHLHVLNVANNQLTGDIPGELLSYLPFMIDLSQNKFSSINNGKPWSVKLNRSVKSFVSLAGNRNLTINISSFMELFLRMPDFDTRLSVLNLSFCDIESPLPGILLYFREMSTCDLRGNKFYGAIPAFMGDFSYLTYFDISSNNLSGSLPAGVQNLISLQYLDISGNPSMREGNGLSTEAFRPDFLRMVKPPRSDNFSCPEGHLTFNNGRIRLDPAFYEFKYCICDPHFYGSLGLCKSCMDGGTCDQVIVTVQEDLSPNIMKMAPGYWPSPDPKNVTHLVKCPVPAACNPMASCTCRLDTSHNDDSYSFNNKRSVSTLITKCNESCICHSGNTDRFCSHCEEGFYKIGGLCYLCVKGDLSYYYVFIPIFAISFLVLLWSLFYFNLRPIKWFFVTAAHFLLTLIFMLLEFLPTWVFKLNLVVFVVCMTSRGKGTKSLISIAVFYMQTMDFMVSSSNVWPPKIVAAQKYLSSYWNLYFPSLSCDFPSLFNPVGKFAFILLLPIGCLALVGVYFIVMLSYNKVRPRERRMENVHFKCRQSAFFCLSFTYFPVVKQTLSILRPCQNDRDVLYMPNSPWIECTSVTYRTLTALGFVSVVVYVIGFPLLLASLVFFFHRKRNSMNQDDRDKLDTWLGPAYLPYKQKYQRYFETVMLLRRLMLAIALSMISSSSTLQTFMVCVILVGFAIIHLCLHPYGDEDNVHRFASENFFEPLVLLALSMSFILLRFSALEISFIYRTTYVWMVMIVNSCILLLLLGTIFYRLVLTGQVDSNGRNGRDGECAERDNLLPVNG